MPFTGESSENLPPQRDHGDDAERAHPDGGRERDESEFDLHFAIACRAG